MLRDYGNRLYYLFSKKYVFFEAKTNEIVVSMLNGKEYCLETLSDIERDIRTVIFCSYDLNDEHIVYCNAIKYKGNINGFKYDDGCRKRTTYGLFYGTEFKEVSRVEVPSYEEQYDKFKKECKAGIFNTSEGIYGFEEILESDIIGEIRITDEELKQNRYNLELEILSKFTIKLKMEFEINYTMQNMIGHVPTEIFRYSASSITEMEDKIEKLKEDTLIVRDKNLVPYLLYGIAYLSGRANNVILPSQINLYNVKGDFTEKEKENVVKSILDVWGVDLSLITNAIYEKISLGEGFTEGIESVFKDYESNHQIALLLGYEKNAYKLHKLEANKTSVLIAYYIGKQLLDTTNSIEVDFPGTRPFGEWWNWKQANIELCTNERIDEWDDMLRKKLLISRIVHLDKNTNWNRI